VIIRVQNGRLDTGLAELGNNEFNTEVEKALIRQQHDIP